MQIIIANTTNASGGGFGHKEVKMYREYPLIFTEGKEAQKARKREKKKAELKEERIKDRITELFVIFNILEPSSNDVGNADTFIRSIIRDGILMSTRR